MDVIAYGGAALGVILATTQLRAGRVDLAGSLLIILLAAFCFARSSERADRWFKGTKLYQENLKDFAAGKGMTARTKVRIMVTVTLLMTVALVAMGVKGIVVGCVVLGFIWAFHMVYFIWFVKTIPA